MHKHVRMNPQTLHYSTVANIGGRTSYGVPTHIALVHVAAVRGLEVVKGPILGIAFLPSAVACLCALVLVCRPAARIYTFASGHGAGESEDCGPPEQLHGWQYDAFSQTKHVLASSAISPQSPPQKGSTPRCRRSKAPPPDSASGSRAGFGLPKLILPGTKGSTCNCTQAGLAQWRRKTGTGWLAEDGPGVRCGTRFPRIAWLCVWPSFMSLTAGTPRSAVFVLKFLINSDFPSSTWGFC